MPKRRIDVVDYDAAWPGWFSAERERLMAAAAAAGVDGEIVAVEHIGSTAVPRLAAKPVLDIMVGLRAWPASDAFVAAMQGAGYLHRGEAGIAGRDYFIDGEPGGARTRQVHAVVHDGWFWRDHLAFRDALRDDSEARAAYAALKRDLAARHRHDIAAYLDGKHAFIREVVRRAQHEAGRGFRGPCRGGSTPWCRAIGRRPMAGRDDELDALMAEQRDYYRTCAAEFDAERRRAESDPGLVAEVAALEQALHRIRPSGAVLELGCGTGNWTMRLAESADRLVAVDAAPEMIDCARAKVEADHVVFVVADLFAWSPPQQFDVVFFAFVLSHVPPPRFDAFWELVDHALAPHGRVMFIDNGPTAAVDEEPVSHPDVPLVRRRLRSGDQYRVVKVFHEPEELRHLLQQRGWQATVQPTGERFYWATAHRNPPSSG